MRTLKELEQEMKEKKAHLTEQYLGEILPLILPEGNWVHDKRFLKYKPDYKNDELKLIVEFDGADHYQSAPVIVRDNQKDEAYREEGYKVVRIPYFIQLNTKTIKMLFGVDVDLDYGYPQGFISNCAVLPASYCEMGIERFIHDTCTFEEIENEIVHSLKDKVEKLGYALVLPDKIRTTYMSEYIDMLRPSRDEGLSCLSQTLASNWNFTMTLLYNFLATQTGTHDFIPMLDTETGLMKGLRWMYRELNNISNCELTIQKIEQDQVIVKMRASDRVIESIISVNSTYDDLLNIAFQLM